MKEGKAVCIYFLLVKQVSMMIDLYGILEFFFLPLQCLFLETDSFRPTFCRSPVVCKYLAHRDLHEMQLGDMNILEGFLII